MNERPADEEVLVWDGVITQLARKRCRMIGVEFDDLVQEARLQIWTMLLQGETPTENDLINAMRRYMRAVREGREVIYGPDLPGVLALPPRGTKRIDPPVPGVAS